MDFQSSDTKNFTRGGQIVLHNIRMFTQVIDNLSWIALTVFLIVTAITIFISTTMYELYVWSMYAWSHVAPLFHASSLTTFTEPNGSVVTVKYSQIIQSQQIIEMTNSLMLKFLRSIVLGLIFGLAVFVAITHWLKRQGEKKAQDNLLKGDKIVSCKDASKMIVKNNKNSDLMLAGLPLIKDTETAHIFFHGTTGSGKSNAIKELLDQIRKRGDRVIIYDKSCSFLEEFYQPDSDILLNPLDHRGRSWDLWSECRDAADFDSLAAAQIPILSTQDPFWINAARTIFSAAAFEMRKDRKRSIAKLLRYLLTSDHNLIEKYLKGTEAETLVSQKNEKTATSIKSVLATYLKSLKYVKDDGADPFSIRKWIQDERASNWLFITSLGDRHETLKPLISSWIDISVNALLSLPLSHKRRIWLILDELTSLQPLPYLTQALSESRKFGGCVVIGVQNYAQLAKVYGHEGAREISSLLNTRFMFRQPDPEMAKWSATNFGEYVMDEMRESVSFGANTIRNGVSMSHVETRKELISFSEIMSLANLHAYVRLPGKFPITLVDFVYKERKRKNIGLLERVIDQNDLNEEKVIAPASEKHDIKITASDDKKNIPFQKKKYKKPNNKLPEKQIEYDSEEPALDL